MNYTYLLGLGVFVPIFCAVLYFRARKEVDALIASRTAGSRKDSSKLAIKRAPGLSAYAAAAARGPVQWMSVIESLSELTPSAHGLARSQYHAVQWTEEQKAVLIRQLEKLSFAALNDNAFITNPLTTVTKSEEELSSVRMLLLANAQRPRGTA